MREFHRVIFRDGLDYSGVKQNRFVLVYEVGEVGGGARVANVLLFFRADTTRSNESKKIRS